MNLLIKHYLSLSTIILASLLFWYPVSDADLGWHLAYGRTYFEEQSIRAGNTFSSQMPDYVWPNHSWGYDVVIYQIYQVFDLIGLSIVGAMLIGLSLWLTLRRFPVTWQIIGLGIFFLFGQYLLDNGIRSQYPSLILLAVLLALLNWLKTKKAIKYFALIPLLFLFWANIHGQFALGLGLLAILVIIPDASYNKKQQSYLLTSSLIAGLMTLINPFGVSLLSTAFEHFNSPAFPFVFEWMPWEWGTPRQTLLVVYSAILGWWIIRIRKTIPSSWSIFLILMMYMAFRARRMIPFYLLVSLPYLIDSLIYLSKSWQPYLDRIESTIRDQKALLAGTVVACLMLVTIPRGVLIQNWETYCNSNVLCSPLALKYTQENGIEGRVFNSYRLGGWLIYHHPELIPYIDGRMTLWVDDSGESPFMRYLTIVHTREGSRELFIQEDFDYVLIHPQFALDSILNDVEEWSLIYQDGILNLYQNPSRSDT